MTSKLNCSVNKFYADQVKHNRFISFIFVSKTKKQKTNKQWGARTREGMAAGNGKVAQGQEAWVWVQPRVKAARL